MQNNRQHKCPFCREETVQGANSGMLHIPYPPISTFHLYFFFSLPILFWGGNGVIGDVADVDDTDNLDHELAIFLKKWFPDEVKTKQRYNELMAGVDQYGEVYATQKCVVM
jgi:E3 ubiquitin-protein ligase BAH